MQDIGVGQASGETGARDVAGQGGQGAGQCIRGEVFAVEIGVEHCFRGFAS